jgi:SSS family solute:Na+ symporter
VQRYLVARTDREAQRATFTGALLCVVIWLTFSTIGSSLWAFYRVTGEALPPEVLQKPDNILPYFVATQFPPGLMGLLLAAILAAAMQAFSADLTSVATVATQDYYARFLPRSSDRSRLLFGRCAVLVGGLMATAVALQLTQQRTRAVYEVFVVLAAVLAGGMLGLFAAGFLSTRTTSRGAYVGIVSCLMFVLWATLTGPLGVDLGLNFKMNSILIGVISHPLLFVVTYLASATLGGKRNDVAGLTIWNLRGQLREVANRC